MPGPVSATLTFMALGVESDRCRRSFGKFEGCVEPDRAARRGELARVVQEIRDYSLHFRGIEWEGRDFLIGEKVHCQTLFLKARRPQTAHFCQALVKIAHF